MRHVTTCNCGAQVLTPRTHAVIYASHPATVFVFMSLSSADRWECRGRIATGASEPVCGLSWFLPWPAHPYLAVASASCLQVVSPAEAEETCSSESDRGMGAGATTAPWSAGGGAGADSVGGRRDHLTEVRLKVLWGCGVRECTCVRWSPDGLLIVASAGAILLLVPRLWSTILQLAGMKDARMRVGVGMGERAAKLALATPDCISFSGVGGPLSWPGSAAAVALREGLMELSKPLAPLQVCVLALIWQSDPGLQGHQGESSLVLRGGEGWLLTAWMHSLWLPVLLLLHRCLPSGPTTDPGS